MSNLGMFSAPLPKAEFVGNFTQLGCDQFFQLTTEIDLTTSPVTLTPGQIISGNIYLHDSVGNVNTPSADDLKTYLGSVPVGFNFTVDLYKSTACGFNWNLGAGITEFRLGAALIVYNTSSLNHSNLKYIYQGGGAWKVFY